MMMMMMMMSKNLVSSLLLFVFILSHIRDLFLIIFSMLIHRLVIKLKIFI
jgi:hypothetical protein